MSGQCAFTSQGMHPVLATYQVEVELPYVECSPNYHNSWRNQADRKKAYKQHVIERVQAAGIPPLDGNLVMLQLDFFLGLTHQGWACRKKRHRKVYEGPGACRTCREPLVRTPEGRYRPRDEDNARGSMKSAQDALKEAVVLRNDIRKHLRQGPTNLHSTQKEHRGRACVVMTLLVLGPAVKGSV